MANGYNGWTNYATWRVNLEIIDDLQENWQEVLDTYDAGYIETKEELTYKLQGTLKEYVDEFMMYEDHGIVGDYARAFLDGVNWYEIAKHIVAQYLEWRDEKHPQTTQTC